jgi:hypothetical protein
MNELAKSLPEIIKEAATSPLGILALMIVGLAILAFFFFRGASERTRLVIFVMLFFGVATFGAAVMHQAGKTRSEDTHPGNTPLGRKEENPPTDIDKPRPLTSKEIRGDGVGEEISYYYTFNAGPGPMKVTVGGKIEPGLVSRRVGDLPDLAVEILDMDRKRLFYVLADLSAIGERKVELLRFGRRQQVIMRILLGRHTLDYMVGLEGEIDFGPAPKAQGPQ